MGALYELAYASGTVLEVWEERIPVPASVKRVAEAAGVDPLKLISSGALIAVAEPDKAEQVVKRLRGMGVAAAVAGRVVARGEPAVIAHRAGGSVEHVKGFVVDEIARLWGSG